MEDKSTVEELKHLLYITKAAYDSQTAVIKNQNDSYDNLNEKLVKSHKELHDVKYRSNISLEAAHRSIEILIKENEELFEVLTKKNEELLKEIDNDKEHIAFLYDCFFSQMDDSNKAYNLLYVESKNIKELEEKVISKDEEIESLKHQLKAVTDTCMKYSKKYIAVRDTFDRLEKE